jgi:peroxiredoxin
MKRYLAPLTLALAVMAAPSAYAALKDGSTAPNFTAQAAMGGKEFKFDLAQALKQGPVVLYFYPLAFSKGCTIEAHDFAEATDQYKSYGAQVIGVSEDKIDTLKKFSVSECQSKFAVAADANGKIMKEYDAVHDKRPEFAQRVSYVIAPDGKVLYSYTDLDPDHHVANTLKALKDWKEQQSKAALAN